MTDAAPGWYPDPRGGDGHRYWTGESWAPDETAAPAPAVDWSAFGASSSSSSGTDPAAYASTYPSAYQSGQAGFGTPGGSQYELSYQPMGPEPPRTAPWRSGAAWLAVSAGVILGFGAGYAVADARHRDADKKAAVRSSASASASPSPAPSPAPSRPPFVESNEPPSPQPSTAPQGPLDRDAALLSRVGLRPTDVDPALTVALIPGGDQVTGQTTLDLCDGTYPSEAHRTARRQVVAVDENGQALLSTEAVLYDSPAALEAAFKELASNSSKCAKTGIDKDWPKTNGVERLAYDVAAVTDTGPQQRRAVVYLRHDRALLALYFQSTDTLSSPVAAQKTVAAATAVFTRRLAALPATAATT
jgi:hypothetical protein